MPNPISWRPKTSVKTRLISVQILLSTFLVVVLAGFLYFPTKDSLENSSNNAYFVLTNNLVATVFNSLAAGDTEGIISAAKGVEGVEGVSYVLVQDEKDKVIYDTLHKEEGKVMADEISRKVKEIKNIDRYENTRDQEVYFEYVAPFLVDNQAKAIVRIAVSKSDIQGEFDNLRNLYVKISSFVIILGIIVSYFISVKLTKPIRKLTENALAIRAGNLDVNAEVHSNDEMEQLAREFRRMVDQLKVFYLKEVHEKEKAIEEKRRTEIINEQLRELDRRKNEFLSIASHQLRTPLSVILWSISLVLEKKDLDKVLGKEEMKMLRDSEKSARTIEKLIGELLDLSRIQRGKRKFTFKTIDIVKFTQDVFDTFQALAQEKEINLTFEKGSKPIPPIISDDHALRHIISNLIDNAIRYTPVKGKVTVRLDNDNDKVILKVIDTGIGVSDEDRERIFKQFTRGERAMRVSPDGSGLGLYLVKQLTEGLRGTVNIESKVGEGSTFIVEMPVRQSMSEEETGAELNLEPNKEGVKPEAEVILAS